jgi:hypothetical protein
MVLGDGGGSSTAIMADARAKTDATPLLVPSKAPRLSPYRGDIDGLRAVAVTAVVLFHIDPKLAPGGFLGVDIFYVISGFVCMGSLMDSTQHNPPPSKLDALLSFYSRRLKRLIPALCLMVTVATVLTNVLIAPQIDGTVLDVYHQSAHLAIVGFANNLYATQQDTYWVKTKAAVLENPFLHCWVSQHQCSKEQPSCLICGSKLSDATCSISSTLERFESRWSEQSLGVEEQ